MRIYTHFCHVATGHMWGVTRAIGVVKREQEVAVNVLERIRTVETL